MAAVTDHLAAVSWPVRTDRLWLRRATLDDVDATWTFRQLPEIGEWISRAPTTKEAYAEQFGLGILPFFPLAGGFLTGKYKRNAPMPEGARLTNNEKAARRYMTEANLLLAEKLEAFAMAHGHTLVELAFSWLASRPFVSSIIAGATRPEQVEQNVTSASWNLSAEEIEEIAGILDAAEG